jgi:hypothetical protein
MPDTSKYELRRANLTELLKERGARTALALKLGVNPSHVSHLLRSPDQQFARPIHEDTAREIEAALGLDPGRLDRQHAGERRAIYTARPVDETPEPTAPAGPVNEDLLEETVRVVVSVATQTHSKLVADKTATLVRLVYEQSRGTGHVDPAFVQQLIKLIR